MKLRRVILVLSAMSVFFSSSVGSATRLEEEGVSDYLDIRKVDLPWYLKSHSEYDQGIAVYKCTALSDRCTLLAETVTYEELKRLLIRYNVVYSVGTAGVITLILVAPIVGSVGGGASLLTAKAVGTGALAASISLIPGTLAALSSRFTDQDSPPHRIKEKKKDDFLYASTLSVQFGLGGGMIGGLIFASEAIGLGFMMGLATLASSVVAVTGGSLVLKMMPGRQMPAGLLPREGPLLRKLLSQKDVLYTNNLLKLERNLVQLIDIIVYKRN